MMLGILEVVGAVGVEAEVEAAAMWVGQGQQQEALVEPFMDPAPADRMLRRVLKGLLGAEGR